MSKNADKQFHKTVIINRAVSGSGKTTLSRCVTEALEANGLTVSVHSTDEFFMKDGRYCFDINLLNKFHAQNLANSVRFVYTVVSNLRRSEKPLFFTLKFLALRVPRI